MFKNKHQINFLLSSRLFQDLVSETNKWKERNVLLVYSRWKVILNQLSNSFYRASSEVVDVCVSVSYILTDLTPCKMPSSICEFITHHCWFVPGQLHWGHSCSICEVPLYFVLLRVSAPSAWILAAAYPPGHQRMVSGPSFATIRYDVSFHELYYDELDRMEFCRHDLPLSLAIMKTSSVRMYVHRKNSFPFRFYCVKFILFSFENQSLQWK